MSGASHAHRLSSRLVVSQVASSARNRFRVIGGNASIERTLSSPAWRDSGGPPKDVFRPRRMSRYGLDRLVSREKKPRGRKDSMEPVSSDESHYDDEYYIDMMDLENMKEVDLKSRFGKDSLIEDEDLTERGIGLGASQALRYTLEERAKSARFKSLGVPAPDPIESALRAADYLTSESGSTEDLVGQRRMLMDGTDSEADRRELQSIVRDLYEEEQTKVMDLGNDDLPDRDPHEPVWDEDEMAKDAMDQYDIKPHHDWSETVVRVDRVQKVQRGGTRVKFRCLVVGGNTKGVAGFGIGKANGPEDATRLAARLCRKNIFFIDRYLGSGLAHDLVGKHNSCKVTLRAVPPGYGLVGHDLVQEILVSFGITDCSAKTHGNRNIYNVVRATFKALLTHESIEDTAMKRGKRLINLERARRLGV